MIIMQSARMVASQLNHQINLLLKRPLTHYWTSPLKVVWHCVTHLQNIVGVLTRNTSKKVIVMWNDSLW